MKNIAERVYEQEKRPKVLGDLELHLNRSRSFLALMRNTTSEGIYTEAEAISLEKVIAETEVN